MHTGSLSISKVGKVESLEWGNVYWHIEAVNQVSAHRQLVNSYSGTLGRSEWGYIYWHIKALKPGSAHRQLTNSNYGTVGSSEWGIFLRTSRQYTKLMHTGSLSFHIQARREVQGEAYLLAHQRIT